MSGMDLVEAIEEIAPTTIEGVNRNITDLSTTFDQETTIMHGLMEDARDDRSELRGRVNLLYRDRPIHHHLAVMSREGGLNAYKMATKRKATRTTRSRPVTTTPPPSTDPTPPLRSTSAQLHAMINKVLRALAALDTTRSDDRHSSGKDQKRPGKLLVNAPNPGLPKMQQNQKLCQEGIEFTTELMEDKTKAYVERRADKKEMLRTTARNNQIQQGKQEADTPERAMPAGMLTGDISKGLSENEVTTTIGVIGWKSKAPDKGDAVGNTGANRTTMSLRLHKTKFLTLGSSSPIPFKRKDGSTRCVSTPENCSRKWTICNLWGNVQAIMDATTRKIRRSFMKTLGVIAMKTIMNRKMKYVSWQSDLKRHVGTVVLSRNLRMSISQVMSRSLNSLEM
ncbi:hypothetical protein Tco_0492526 [Tanacetum coccineum]